MRRNKVFERDCDDVASILGVDSSDVKKAVLSFFDAIALQSRSLPFNTERKIFSKEKFDTYVTVQNIPCIGRIGPVYSRYLKWRANESKSHEQKPRSLYRSRMLQDDIEHMAEEVLSGKTPSPLRKYKKTELYNSVWLVGTDGKKQARQVIPKTKSDGI